MNRHTRTLICRHTYIDEANGNIYGKLNAYTARIECELQGTSSLSLWSLFCVRRFCSLAPSLSLSFYPFFCFVNFLNANMRMSVYIYIHLQPTTDIHMNSENAFRDNCKRFSHLHTACIQLRASFINMCVRVWERVQKQRKRILCMDVNEFHVTLQLTVSERMCCVCISTLFLIYSRHLLTLRWTQVLMREFVTRLYAIKTIEWRWWWVDWWVVRVSVSVFVSLRRVTRN